MAADARRAGHRGRKVPEPTRAPPRTLRQCRNHPNQTLRAELPAAFDGYAKYTLLLEVFRYTNLHIGT